MVNNNGFPIFPKVGDNIKFNQTWSLVTGEYVQQGTIGQILDVSFVDGYDHDKMGGMYLAIGIVYNGRPLVLKFNYLERSDVISIIPSSPAAQVLFGRK